MEARRNTWNPVLNQIIFRNKRDYNFILGKTFTYPSGRSRARILGSSLTGACMSVSRECCVLSGRGLCVCLIIRAGKSYLVRFVWVWSWSCFKGRRWPGIRSKRHRKQKATCGTQGVLTIYLIFFTININIPLPSEKSAVLAVWNC
jgi:hypothetical protein